MAEYGPPLNLGNILEGRKPIRYLVGYHYDFEYRQTHIKALADYSKFFIMCPLRGVVYGGKTLKATIRKIDREHAAEGAFMPGEGPPRADADLTVIRVLRKLMAHSNEAD